MPRPICRNVLEDFCCINLEDFPGDFPGGFFWALFPTKMRRKNPARKSAKKSGGSKIKIREKSVLPKAGPKIFLHLRGFLSFSWDFRGQEAVMQFARHSCTTTRSCTTGLWQLPTRTGHASTTAHKDRTRINHRIVPVMGYPDLP